MTGSVRIININYHSIPVEGGEHSVAATDVMGRNGQGPIVIIYTRIYNDSTVPTVTSTIREYECTLPAIGTTVMMLKTIRRLQMNADVSLSC